jgi:dual specificity protein kinase YAK1
LDPLIDTVILQPGDTVDSPDGHRYQVVNPLGNGHVYQVTEFISGDPQHFALKISTSEPDQWRITRHQSEIIQELTNSTDPSERAVFPTFISAFPYRGHFVLIIELLGSDLYSLLRSRQFAGFPLFLIQTTARQLLQALSVLHRHGLIHGDLKPENVLLPDDLSDSIKLIDFGSTQAAEGVHSSTVQTIWYRAPEVILGEPYGFPIDLWSLGCVLGEMHVGLPLFSSETPSESLSAMFRLLGPLPADMVAQSPFKEDLFLEDGTLKPREQYCREHRLAVGEAKEFFRPPDLASLLTSLPLELPTGRRDRARFVEWRGMLADLIERLLAYRPDERISIEEALQHPFMLIDFDEG